MLTTEIPRITADETKRRLDAGGRILLVDVRSREAYDRSHIPGALSVPVKDIEARFREVPVDRTVVTY